jgi:extracellular elastinolytic metalloproteinase
VSCPTIPLDDAICTTEAALEGTFNGHPAMLEFLVCEDGSLALTHVMQIQNEETGVWVEVFVDAHSGDLLSITDFVTKAQVRGSRGNMLVMSVLQYIVLPIQKEIPTQGFELLVDPQDSLGAS